MAIVTSKEMFAKAYEGGYAIGAFNVNNMEIIQGITEAAMENRAPLILQVRIHYYHRVPIRRVHPGGNRQLMTEVSGKAQGGYLWVLCGYLG